MLRGILSRKWRDAIAEYTKERISSKAGHLVKVIWKQVFDTMGNQWKMILHTEEIVAIIKEQEMLEKKLIRFWHNFRELFQYTQYNLVDYSEDKIMQWGIDTKREMVNVLLAERLSYAAMLRKGDKKQSLITDFWKWCTTVTSGVIPVGSALLVDRQ